MKRIVVGLDGSPHERRVLDAAIETARAFRGMLILLRAVSLPAGLPPFALAASPDEVRRRLEEAAEQHLRSLVVDPSLVEKIHVEMGTPWHALCDFAATQHADLIIIGSHGYGGLDRLLGTTAAKVVNHARCSVLVVHAG